VAVGKSGRVPRDFALQDREQHPGSAHFDPSCRNGIGQLLGYGRGWRLYEAAPGFLFGITFPVEFADFRQAAQITSLLIQGDCPLLQRLIPFGQLIRRCGHGSDRGGLGGLRRSNSMTHLIESSLHASECACNFLRRIREAL
jgi:hypothetical protein